ncbi:phosphatidylserine decarboxylase [Kitasatospora sp. NPDC057512]|uniref:phosphatidylserine decarboxylase n=1 Tax=Kitasatospora sp. NPDC057512 TaxID=3346154 RepID=UPI0036A9C168
MTTTSTSTEVIEELKKQLDNDQKLAELLKDSLQQARTTADKKLRKPLFTALAWPTTIPDYLDYLTTFSEWKPRQDAEAAWSDDKGGYQEVYDRLCHFYYLIDQKVTADDNRIVQNDPWFKEWLVRFTKAWGSFLDTTASFSDEQLKSFEDDAPRYRVQDSMVDGKPNEPSGWLTFNQFFARELNPGLRPITDPEHNATVTLPADCIYKKQYHIEADSEIHPTGDPLRLKLTHEVTTIPQLLSEKSEYGKKFAKGTFVHYFLAPYSYHRFHTPVAGRVKECFPIHANTYLDVTIDGNGQFDAPDNSTDGYEFTQARGVIVIDTADSPYGDIGLVAIVPVGMAQVSSVKMTMTVGAQVPKGEEFGYFLFGGSDIILLFQEGKTPEIDPTDGYHHYGTSISVPPAETDY